MKKIVKLFKGEYSFITTVLSSFLSLLIIMILEARFIAYPDRFRNKFYDPMSWNDIYTNIDIFVVPTIMISILFALMIKYAKRHEFTNNENKHKSNYSNDPVLDEIIQDALQSGKKEKKDDAPDKPINETNGSK
ncbi:MAG: hypothetical protein EOL95_08215 [Bacteroidia bacterium]|nr:hypothetical protein [Bacteroidia bacterium]